MTRLNRQTIVTTASTSSKLASGGRTTCDSSSSDVAGDCACGRVLVVDDFAQARESIADVLRAAGHQVACAASASEALVQMEKESFDVVVTDLQMPGMSGLEFIKRLQSRPHGAADFDGYGPRHGAIGRRCHAPRRVRLHRKTVRRRSVGTFGFAPCNMANCSIAAATYCIAPH